MEAIMSNFADLAIPKMRGPNQMHIICIDVTNKCDLACSNCTRLLENDLLAALRRDWPAARRTREWRAPGGCRPGLATARLQRRLSPLWRPGQSAGRPIDRPPPPLKVMLFQADAKNTNSFASSAAGS
jgi:hypothetical protein